MKRPLVLFGTIVAVLAIPLMAAAHNAGHIFLPDGTCLEIGSFKNAPLVGQDRTRLDLVPETPYPPFDEIGVSFVGHWQRTDILPGPCPAALAPTNTVAPSPSSSNGTRRPDSQQKPDAAGRAGRKK